MIKVTFYENEKISKDKIDFVVIMAKYNNKWIVVRHQERATWEIPGGHVEINEDIEEAALRELYEETGAKQVNKIVPIAIYSVIKEEKETFGQLYYADVKELGNLPQSEIAEIKLVDKLPKALTYPLIQPYLYEKVMNFLMLKSI